MRYKPIYFDNVFLTHYRKRILKDKRLHQSYIKAVNLFIEDPFNPLLRNHKLKGKLKSWRAFFIAKDCRVIYLEEVKYFLFLDIGKHDEVYR